MAAKSFVFSMLAILFGQTLAWAQSTQPRVVLHPTLVNAVVERLDAGANFLSLAPDGSLFTSDLRSTWSGVGKEGTSGVQILNDGTVSTVIRKIRTPSGCAFDSDGNLFLASFHGGSITKFNTKRQSVAVISKGVSSPSGISIEPSGNLVFCNCWGNTIQRIVPSGKSKQICNSKLLNNPWGIVTSADGTHFVSNGSDGKVIRIQANGDASELCMIPGGGNGGLSLYDDCLYVAGRKDNRIYRVTMDGSVFVFLGTGTRGSQSGVPSKCSLSSPIGITINSDGTTMYVSESAAAEKSDSDQISPSRILRIELRKEKIAIYE